MPSDYPLVSWRPTGLYENAQRTRDYVRLTSGMYNVAKHQNNCLNDDVRPISSVPYRARLTASKFTAAEIGNMIKEKIIEQAASDCVSRIVFSQRRTSLSAFASITRY